MLGKNGVQNHDTTTQQTPSCSRLAVFYSLLLGSNNVEAVDIRAKEAERCRDDAKNIKGKEGEEDCSAGSRCHRPAGPESARRPRADDTR